MKPHFLAKLHVIAFALASAHHAYADDATWNSITDAAWATESNWFLLPNPVPSTGNTATFDNAGGLDDIIDLGAGVTISSIVFDTANVAAYTIGSGGAGAQNLDIDGATVTFNVAGTLTAPAAKGLPDLTGTAWEYHTFKLDASEVLGGISVV